MAEDFGIQGRGAFYDKTGAIRDVIQNHIIQLICNVAMEPPADHSSESIRNEKVKVLKSIPGLKPEDVVRGQFKGYQDEPGVAKGSEVETFAAIKLQVYSLAMVRHSILYSCGNVGGSGPNYIRTRISSEITNHPAEQCHRCDFRVVGG